MNFSQRMRGLVKAIAIVWRWRSHCQCLPSRTPTPASAAASRRARAARAPSPRRRRPTRRPSTAQPFNRTFTPAFQPRHRCSPAGGGFFNRPGGGLLGGLAAGFLGAGLLGMLFGGGLFSGLGGFSSILGLLLQIVLIVFLVRMAMSWWQRRQMSQPAYAGAAGAARRRQQLEFRRHGLWPGLGQRAAADPACRL